MHLPRSKAIQAALVAMLALAVYVPGIWASGFSHSEGFRVYPAYAMLDSGDWLMIRLFEQPYLRKPPGMLWAVAISSELLGRTEFAARLVSALAMTLLALASWAFVRRWFGGAWGMLAGAAAALFPWLWYPGRSAEIESLHNFFTAWCCLLLLGRAMLARTEGAGVGDCAPPVRLLHGLGVALGFGAMLLTKGPAGLPVVLAGVVACAAGLAPRGLRGRVALEQLGALALGGAIFGVWLLALTRAKLALGQAAVLQSPEEFLFEENLWLKVLTLPVASLIAALPWALALLVIPWHGAGTPRGALLRAMGLTIVLATLGYTLAGLGNNRYVQPAATLLPALAGGAAWWLAQRWGARARREAMIQLGVLLVALSAGAIAHNTWQELRRRDRTSGTPVGREIGPLLRGPAQLYSDALLDARPEVLYTAMQVARAGGQEIRVRWMPLALFPDGAPPLPPAGSYLALRTDERGQALARELGKPSELDRYRAAGLETLFEHVGAWDVHKENFQITLYRRRGDSPSAR